MSAYVDIQHKTKGNCTNITEASPLTSPTELIAGVDPTPTVNSIAVAIASGALAAAIATAAAAAINADTAASMPYRCIATTSTADLILTNVRGGVVADVVDVDTGWSSFVETTAGSDTRVTDMGQNVAAADYKYRPTEAYCAYLRRLTFVLCDDDVTDASKFGNLTALTNGLNIQIRKADGTVRKTLNGLDAIKTNAMLQSLGLTEITAGTIDTLQIDWDLVESFGGEIPVDGKTGEYLCVDINDNLNGISPFVCRVHGHLKDTLG
jgi:hypothetical protein